jgi:putative glutamine amidotransferase
LQPFIGITTGIRFSDEGWRYYGAYAPNVLALERAGALPVLIPCGLQEATLRAIYQRLDAVLIPGGGDVDPRHYGAEKHPLTDRIDPERDDTELTVTRWAVEDDLPLFGICRGHQVMNVALGGTLVQDIPSQIDTPITHYVSKELPRSAQGHEVSIHSTSRLAKIIGSTTVAVNSYHHQSVERPAPAAHVTAHAPDGIVEAMEVPDRRFVLSVQWHPEDMVGDDEAMQRLFDAFVDAARERAAR